MAEAAAAEDGELQRRAHPTAKEQLPAEALAQLARGLARLRTVRVGVGVGVGVGVRVRVRVGVRVGATVRVGVGVGVGVGG